MTTSTINISVPATNAQLVSSVVRNNFVAAYNDINSLFNRTSVSVKDFGASGDGINDDTSAIQTAVSLGGRIYVPAGTYKLSAAITIPANTVIYGDGGQKSKLSFTHTGDGLKSIWPINSSTAANVTVANIGIFNNNGANAGGGFVDVGGTFVHVQDCSFSGWKYGVIYDQTEVATIDRNIFNGMTTAQLWLVNGPDHTIGALKGFTNRITITRNQFNAGTTVILIQDDGGGCHTISDNNFNGGSFHWLAAGVSGFTFAGNECELPNDAGIWFKTTTASGTYVGGCAGGGVENNILGGSTGSSIFIDALYATTIAKNAVFQPSNAVCGFRFNPGIPFNNADITVMDNYQVNDGAGITLPPLVAASQLARWKQQGRYLQSTQTYVAASSASGAVTITPATMVDIYDGAILQCLNNDGTNPETVTISVDPSTPTVFYATLASTKTANWRIFVQGGEFSGNYNPDVTGSGPVGGTTKTVQYGSYIKKDNRCFFQASVTWTALTGGASGQLKLSLPLRVNRRADSLAAIPVLITGPIAIGNGALFLVPNPNTFDATLVKVDQATGAITPVAIGATGTLYISGNYEI